MTKDSTLTIRLDQATKQRLGDLAKQLNRSKSFVAAEAIAEFVAVQEWQIAGIKQALAEVDAGKSVPHADVVRWVESWGTDHELPRPVARKRRK